jgi:hypothetical protein
MVTTTGFFVDWDDKSRRVKSPGAGMTFRSVDRGPIGVDVIDADGFVIHEATFFPTLEAMAAAGVIVELI